MAQKTYHFDCKNCGHEYLHNAPTSNCPECNQWNQNNGKLNKQ